MILSFVNPNAHHRVGGVVVLYRFANALAQRGHEIRFFHREESEEHGTSLDGVAWFPFDPRIEHLVVESLDDPGLPPADVILSPFGPSHLGAPAVFIQGYQMVPLEIERAAYRMRGPKICVARWLLDVGRGFGVPDEQLWHVPMGLDHDLFRVRTPLDRRSYDVALLHNPHPQKGWGVGLLALEELRSRRPELRAVAFGSSAPRVLPPWVEFQEALDHEALADRLYNGTKVFIQSSYVEGFGLTAVEAMACGAALVTTDNGGARDYALHDETALVVPPAEPVAVADAVEALLVDDARRARIAEAGADLVRRYTWEKGAAQLEERLLRYVEDPTSYQRAPADDGGEAAEDPVPIFRSFIPE